MKGVVAGRAVAVTMAFACALAAPAGIGTAVAQAAPAEPIVVIVLENKTYQTIVGSSSAPYIQSLIAAGTLYTNYQAAPGSLPDYLRMTGGIATTSAAKKSDNIFHQLQTAGISWGQYNESMPSACYTKSGPLPYDKSHNAAVWYNDITSNKAACANMLPYTAFDPAHPRSFSYVVPNDNDDMHTGSSKTAQIKAGDAWLKANVPAMLAGGAEVIVTWDEGTRSNEHIATIAIGGTAKKGATDGTAYTHFGLLAGLEDVYGVPLLNAAQTATPVPIK
ncbi:MAG TPA: alkaline phosphatase family protein [Gaiellales bacterium]|jgi:acid phosphatase